MVSKAGSADDSRVPQRLIRPPAVSSHHFTPMTTRPTSSYLPTLFRTLIIAGLPATAAYAQVQVAENLLINLNAATFNTGSGIWSNTGTLTGDFVADNTSPTRFAMDGGVGVLLDSTDHFLGPNSTPGIDGNGTVSIEVWAYQGNIKGEETLVAWGHRGSNNQNMSFNYGTDDRFGAVGHWAGADIGWGPNDPNGTGQRAPGTPVEGQWHLLSYTYDGATQRVYKDGALVNQENISLNVFQGFPIQIGAQRNGDAVPIVEPGLKFSGLVGQVRVHDGVLSDTQVTQNFNAEKGNYHYDAAGTYLPKATTPLAKAPVHRYTFNNQTQTGDGAVIPDVAGVGANKADGMVRGSGAIVSGTTGIDLPGGASGSAAYIDLPNGIISGTFNGGAGYLSATFETWITIQGNQNWSRVMDFGTTDAGEITGPGGGFSSSRSLMLSATNGTAPNMRFEIAGVAAGPGAGTRDSVDNKLGIQMHVVVLYDPSVEQWQWWRNGELQESFESVGGDPSTIPDVNNWLGRSNWSGDSNTDAIYNEFRVYDYALSAAEIRGNFAAGPDTVTFVPEPATWTALVGGAGLLVGLQRMRRKTGLSSS